MRRVKIYSEGKGEIKGKKIKSNNSFTRLYRILKCENIEKEK